MKKTITLIALLLYTVVAFAQNEKDLDILKADSTWLKEIIKFPLNFASEINYEGYEDLRFAKDWINPEGTEFWTYAFAWNINLESPPNAEMLEINLKLYYDGLMTAVNKDKDFTIPESVIVIKKIEEKYKGKMQVYDSFFTDKVITLFVDVETNYCKDQNKFVMLFRVSSLDFENSIWNSLKAVKLIKNHCEKS